MVAVMDLPGGKTDGGEGETGGGQGRLKDGEVDAVMEQKAEQGRTEQDGC